MPSQTTQIQELIQTVEALRGPEGCPWDRKQTLNSLTKYLSEECGELIDAIKKDDSQEICEELGDLFFILLLICQVSKEENRFTYEDMLGIVNAKLIRRHPHVFAGLPTGDEESLRRQWERIKQEEKTSKK